MCINKVFIEEIGIMLSAANVRIWLYVAKCLFEWGFFADILGDTGLYHIKPFLALLLGNVIFWDFWAIPALMIGEYGIFAAMNMCFIFCMKIIFCNILVSLTVEQLTVEQLTVNKW